MRIQIGTEVVKRSYKFSAGVYTFGGELRKVIRLGEISCSLVILYDHDPTFDLGGLPAATSL